MQIENLLTKLCKPLGKWKDNGQKTMRRLKLIIIYLSCYCDYSFNALLMRCKDRVLIEGSVVKKYSNSRCAVFEIMLSAQCCIEIITNVLITYSGKPMSLVLQDTEQSSSWLGVKKKRGHTFFKYDF